MKVYVVLEHAKGKKDAHLHGVYGHKKYAEKKKEKLLLSPKSGYVSVLKKDIVVHDNMEVALHNKQV